MKYLQHFFSYLLISLFIVGCAPQSSENGTLGPYGMTTDVEYIKHEQENFEVEIRILEGKVETLESTIAMLQQQQAESDSINKRRFSGNMSGIEERFDRYQSTQGSVIDDLRKLKTHTNNLVTSVEQNKKKVKEFERLIQKQNQDIENLENAFNSLIAVLDRKGGGIGALTSSSGQVYTVRSGDSLDRIARKFGVSVKKLKAHNRLEKDLIVIGQKLKIPE